MAFKLKHDIEKYYPSVSAAEFSVREMRALYSEYRKVATKRINRIRDSEYADSENARRIYAPLPKDATNSQVRKALYDVALFLNSKGGSLSGMRRQRKKFVETMHDRGYYFVTLKNADEFGRYMDAVRYHYGNRKGYYPEGAVELFEEIVDKKADPNIIMESFGYYLDKPERIPDMREMQKQERRMEESYKRKKADRKKPSTQMYRGNRKLRPVSEYNKTMSRRRGR